MADETPYIPMRTVVIFECAECRLGQKVDPNNPAEVREVSGAFQLMTRDNSVKWFHSLDCLKQHVKFLGGPRLVVSQ